mgnify:CR=1 FL=1|tara:strand:- start:21 stop:710 length:690 start_codon:yes stop_codon:yes gene_type:complete
MKKIFILIIIIFSFSLVSEAIPIPKNNKATFDVIRKNKVIGSIETIFKINKDKLIINTVVDIEVKVLFIPAYKFLQKSEETWSSGQFIEINAYTDFEDEREYYVKGKVKNNSFYASGMDGELVLDKDILPLNYWNKNILNKKNVFDTQKGIVREISVQQLNDEIIEINKIKINTKKYILNASSNPKDKGPFPEYTLWYAENDELVKFKFTNWKDKKEVITQRNNWESNN